MWQRKIDEWCDKLDYRSAYDCRPNLAKRQLARVAGHRAFAYTPDSTLEMLVQPTTNRICAITCLLLAMALWGSSFVALKFAFAEMPPLWVIFSRMALGSLVFLCAWRWRGHLEYRAGDWKYLLGLAICEPCLYFVFEAIALQNTSASQAGMITAMLPLMVAVGAFVFLRERITRAALAGFALAVIGVIWLSLTGETSEHAPAPLLGNFFEFLAMLCAMGYILTLKYLSSRYSAFWLTAMQSFVGAVFFLPLAVLSAPFPETVSTAGIWAVIYLGLLVTVGAYGLYNYAVSHIPANQAAAFINLIPIFTLLLAVMLLGETLNTQQILGSTLVFVGVVLSQWRNSTAPVAAGVLD